MAAFFCFMLKNAILVSNIINTLTMFGAKNENLTKEVKKGVKEVKNKVIFYFLSLTWGLPMTLLGALISLVLICAGYKPKRFHHFIYFEIGEKWGGFESGMFFFVNKNPSLHLKQHEAGHGIQNCIFGFFMPFISLWSVARYWYRKLKKGNLPPYDSIWFEGQATKLGKKHFGKDR